MQDINFQNIKKFGKMLSEATAISVVSHMKPDGDAVGSCMALHHFLNMTGRHNKVVLPHFPPESIGFLTAGCEEDIIIHESDAEKAESVISRSDLIICLDFNAFHRTDKLEKPLADSHARKVLIDHHLNPDRKCFTLSFSETEVSSASELLFHILMAMPEIGSDAARLPSGTRDALMTGMTTDTNNFGNSVFPSTMQMASSLLAAGTDRDRILSLLYNRFSEDRLRLMGHMMKDLMTLTDDGVAYIVLDSQTQRKYNVREGDTEGFVNMPLSIESVRMSLLLKEDGDRIRVSIRSKKGTSANRCAQLHFNGGGHENAAGGRLSVPGDICDIAMAGKYIEEHTHSFMTDEK